jgi:hypothetical protein
MWPQQLSRGGLHGFWLHVLHTHAIYMHAVLRPYVEYTSMPFKLHSTGLCSASMVWHTLGVHCLTSLGQLRCCDFPQCGCSVMGVLLGVLLSSCNTYQSPHEAAVCLRLPCHHITSQAVASPPSALRPSGAEGECAGCFKRVNITALSSPPSRVFVVLGWTGVPAAPSGS